MSHSQKSSSKSSQKGIESKTIFKRKSPYQEYLKKQSKQQEEYQAEIQKNENKDDEEELIDIKQLEEMQSGSSDNDESIQNLIINPEEIIDSDSDQNKLKSAQIEEKKKIDAQPLVEETIKTFPLSNEIQL